MINHLSIVALGIACAAIFVPTDAAAQQYIQNGGMCESALPVFAGTLRTRPTAISNEGTGNAFVSCSMFDRLGNTHSIAGVWLLNRNGAAVNMSCTYVNGNIVDGTTLFPKVVSYGPGAEGYILWNKDVDNGGANFNSQANFSCNLPPGTELRIVTFDSTTNL